MAPVRILAPAKVNLFLHVGPVGADGYHPLSSLVAFADVGDSVTVETAGRLSLTVTGPFARGLDDAGDNLIFKALRALGQAAGGGEPPLAAALDKQLPVAAGLGGGSSDAGAALKAARDLLDLALDDDALAGIAAAVGADGPMCLHARAAWAEGRGDRLTFEPRLPPLPALLINPGVPSPTGAVYRAYDEAGAGGADRPDPPANWTPASVIRWLTDQRNDLEAPAVSLQPAIAAALSEARRLPGVRLVRMSGSGATVFALFDTVEQAAQAAGRLTKARPDWWVRAATLR
ncbi:4-(cytidine 5'-diphospho)-2-C-methyl-D-erythritol kinase [Brevundimonas sp.]|uniref:4-(cytidine 5'-diphospho)-2-C-methyl-D-erythritol kinase n=1 Tax=Brevundimonas sp. TaxID=1871086 RepID=UPI002FCBBDCD